MRAYSCTFTLLIWVGCSAAPDPVQSNGLGTCGPTELPALTPDAFDEGRFEGRFGETLRLRGLIVVDPDSGCADDEPELYLQVAAEHFVRLVDFDPDNGSIDCETYPVGAAVSAWGEFNYDEFHGPDPFGSELPMLMIVDNFDDNGGHCEIDSDSVRWDSGPSCRPTEDVTRLTAPYFEPNADDEYAAEAYVAETVQLIGQVVIDPASCNDGTDDRVYLEIGDASVMLLDFDEEHPINCDSYAPGRQITAWGELQIDGYNSTEHSRGEIPWLLLLEPRVDRPEGHCAQLMCGADDGSATVVAGDQLDEFGSGFEGSTVQLYGQFVHADCDEPRVYLATEARRVRLADFDEGIDCTAFADRQYISAWGNLYFDAVESELLLVLSEVDENDTTCLDPRTCEAIRRDWARSISSARSCRVDDDCGTYARDIANTCGLVLSGSAASLRATLGRLSEEAGALNQCEMPIVLGECITLNRPAPVFTCQRGMCTARPRLDLPIPFPR